MLNDSQTGTFDVMTLVMFAISATVYKAFGVVIFMTLILSFGMNQSFM